MKKLYLLIGGIVINMELGDIATWLGSIGTVGTLIYTLKQLKISRQENKKQNKIANRERFENTLFNLLSFNNDIINSINYDGLPGRKKNGREYFRLAYDDLCSCYGKRREGNEFIDNDAYYDELEYIQNIYGRFYETHQDHIGHYFRNLYHIIKFIDKNNVISEEDKKYYASIVRAQLSTYELLLIFYNSISNYGKEKFLPLILKYDLLQPMNKKLLINTHHNGIYGYI